MSASLILFLLTNQDIPIFDFFTCDIMIRNERYVFISSLVTENHSLSFLKFWTFIL